MNTTSFSRSKLLYSLLVVLLATSSMPGSALTQNDVIDLSTSPLPKQVTEALNEVNTSVGTPPGELVYLINTLPPGPPRRITYDLVFQTTGQGALLKPNNVYQITADYANLLYNCRFSPDGEYVSICEGFPYGDASTYRLFLWNRKTKQLQSGPEASLCFPFTYWSPNSQQIAYIQGGDTSGEEAHGTGPLRLNIFDVKTGKTRFIAENPEVKSLSWTSQGTLLYTIKQHSVGETADAYDAKHPDVYEVTTSGSASKLIANAFDPLPSQDGKLITFFGWGATTVTSRQKLGEDGQSRTGIGQFGIYLFNRTSPKRKLIRPLYRYYDYPGLFWSADGKHLFSIKTTYVNVTPSLLSKRTDLQGYFGYAKGQIDEIDTSSLASKELTVVEAKDKSPRYGTSAFRLIGTSSDHRFLYITVNEIGESPDHGISNYVYHDEQAIDLLTGKVYKLWMEKGAEGIDWRGQ